MFSPLFKRAGCGVSPVCHGRCCLSELCCGTCCDGTGQFCCGKNSCCSSDQFCCGDGLCCSSEESCAFYQDLSNETRSICTTGTGSPNATITLDFDSPSTALSNTTTSSSGETTTAAPTSSVSAQPTTTPLSSSAAPTSFPPTSTQAQTHISSTKDLSGGIIAGIVLGALSVLLLITGAYIFLRRRKQHNQPQSPSEKPIGGRHELSAESSDPSKHLSEAEAVGTMVNEMHVPPHEAGGAAVHELAAEEPAVEVGVGDGDAGSGGRASVEDRRV